MAKGYSSMIHCNKYTTDTQPASAEVISGQGSKWLKGSVAKVIGGLGNQWPKQAVANSGIVRVFAARGGTPDMPPRLLLQKSDYLFLVISSQNLLSPMNNDATFFSHLSFRHFESQWTFKKIYQPFKMPPPPKCHPGRSTPVPPSLRHWWLRGSVAKVITGRWQLCAVIWQMKRGKPCYEQILVKKLTTHMLITVIVWWQSFLLKLEAAAVDVVTFRSRTFTVTHSAIKQRLLAVTTCATCVIWISAALTRHKVAKVHLLPCWTD
jgi:hypothetical protein